jgi:adenosylcobinamide-GDP ribazoletransferase
VRAALAFLTPLGGARTPSARALPWFPIVGAAIGLTVGGVWWGATRVWTPLVGAALAVIADLALTGMLHVDGLADSADGLLPHLPSRERRLEVMAQPDVGAFGVAVVAAVLVLRVATLASMHPRPLVCAAVWGATRAAAAVAMTRIPYARPSGLATAFAGGPRMLVLAIAAVFVLTLPSALAVVAAFGVVALGVRRLGGYTGDVLGAAIVVGETIGLLVAAA